MPMPNFATFRRDTPARKHGFSGFSAHREGNLRIRPAYGTIPPLETWHRKVKVRLRAADASGSSPVQVMLSRIC